MSCEHGNHPQACDFCDALEDAYRRGYESAAVAYITKATPQPVIAPKWAMLTVDEIYNTAEPFGSFQYGDSQGDKRKDFAAAIQAAFIAKQGAAS